MNNYTNKNKNKDRTMVAGGLTEFTPYYNNNEKEKNGYDSARHKTLLIHPNNNH